jgi:hypothetical protein
MALLLQPELRVLALMAVVVEGEEHLSVRVVLVVLD